MYSLNAASQFFFFITSVIPSIYTLSLHDALPIFHAVRVLVHDDRHDLRRRHGVDHELGRIIDVGNDVDALAGDLVGHRLHARAAHADAGPHRIDARVVAAHRDLGAHSGVARPAAALDEALPDLGDFELE